MYLVAHLYKESARNLYPSVATLAEGFLRKGEWLNSEGQVLLARGDVSPLFPNHDQSLTGGTLYIGAAHQGVQTSEPKARWQKK